MSFLREMLGLNDPNDPDLREIDNTRNEGDAAGLEIEGPPPSRSDDEAQPAEEEQSPAERELADNESVYSHFSDSSSSEDEPQTPNPPMTETEDEPTTPLPSSSELAAPKATKRTTISWDDLQNLDFGDPDDPDADAKMRSALRQEEHPDADAEMKAQWRLQEEGIRGYEYEKRPGCVKRWYGEDIARNSVRGYWGRRLSEGDVGVRSKKTEGWTKRSSRLGRVRGVDDVSPDDDSPESPEDVEDWEWEDVDIGVPLRRFSGPESFVDPGNDADDEFGEWHSEEPITQEAGDVDDTAEEPDALPETTSAPPIRPSTNNRPNLHISTSTRPPETQTPNPKDEESPTSEEELELMTQLSPHSAWEKLRDLYSHLKGMNMADPAETLAFKRKLLKFSQKKLVYNSLGDDVPKFIEESADSTLLEMYVSVAAHLYRAQRDEFRVKAMEEFELRSEVERLRVEDGEEIGMLKFEVDQREGAKQKLEETRKALKQKTEEAMLWKKAHEKASDAAKAEYDRKDRQVDATAQTESDLNNELEARNEHLNTRNEELENEINSLQHLIDNVETQSNQLCKDYRELVTRNDELEERVEESNAAWQDLLDVTVNVSDRKTYLTDMCAENARLKEDNGRLRKLLTDWKMWQEEQEKERKEAAISKPALPAAAEDTAVPSTTPAASSSILPALPKKQHWIEREERIRNTESYKRNRDEILRRFALEDVRRKKALEAEK